MLLRDLSQMEIVNVVGPREYFPMHNGSVGSLHKVIEHTQWIVVFSHMVSS